MSNSARNYLGAAMMLAAAASSGCRGDSSESGDASGDLRSRPTQSPPQGSVTLEFPATGLGQLRYRPYGSQETFAHSLGDARGVVTVPAGVELFFAIDPRPGRDISSLANVPPHLVKGVQMIRALVNDEGLASLRNFDAMEILILDGTRIGDEGVKHLSGLASLRMLGLEGTKITDAGLAHLEGLKNLESLSVGYTNVTPEALAKLREHLPKLKEIRGETMLGPPKPIDSKTILP